MMRERTLKLLQNQETKKYIEEYDKEDDSILWVKEWSKAKDFKYIFFAFRPFLRLYLQYKFQIKLKYKTYIVYEALGE